MGNYKRLRAILLTACVAAVVLVFGRVSAVQGIAAEVTTTDNKQNDLFDREVKAWLDAGGSIPTDVKYATYSGTGHLWVLDSTDLSDGVVELSGNEGTITVSGNGLLNWLNSQFFYKETLGREDSRVKFVRPKKSKAF